ncbi:MAG: hypothetical protein ABGX47_01050 [Martelella sp.]|uniref:hypothetical protein n=1 Tax=Martelella sp. TaxID=1969699 RepID=UPI003242E0E3
MSRWGALTQDEAQQFGFDLVERQVQAERAAFEQLRVNLCGSETGAACDTIVQAEIDRKKAQAARIGGAVMVVGGALEVVAAGAIATTCQTGFTCAAAGAIAFSGADNAGTGIAMLWTGEQQTTIGANILLGLMNAVIRYIRFE